MSACILVLSVVALLLSGPALAQSSPPPLPYDWWTAFVTLTEVWLPVAGTSVVHSSVGFHAVVSGEQAVRCRHGIQQLIPADSSYVGDVVANYTSGVRTSRVAWQNGTVTNCTSEALSGAMPAGGAPYLAPSPALMAEMAFLTYTQANGVNCSVYQYVGADANGNRFILQWYVQVGNDFPQLLVNQTFYNTPFVSNGTAFNSIVRTSAIVGYEVVDAWPTQCSAPNVCGSQVCVAFPAAGSAAIDSALGWVCAGPINCDDIGQGGPAYYPNNDLAHASWAFQTYYAMAAPSQGSSACDFNGAAVLTACSPACTTCQASATASDAELLAAIQWVCNDGGADCTSIQPGHAHFLPNTPQAHASYLFNQYYQALKCLPPSAATWCDFNGTATIAKC